MGDRSALFSAALSGLEKDEAIVVIRGSGVYETEPVGPGDQDPYWNAVLEVDTSRSPRSLLESCLRLEKDLGRVRGARWGPRLIDLDLLLFEDLEIREPDLEVPHPRLTERSFVLLPLADLIPGRVVKGKTILEWLERCGPVEKNRIRESLWPWR